MKRLLLALFLLSGCAPVLTEPERASATLPFDRVSFYPLEAGVSWEYLEDGERVDAPRLFRENLGPSVLGGQRYSLVRTFGRGHDSLLYYVADRQGVRLAREERGGLVFLYNPPMKVMSFTTEGELAASWSGESEVSGFLGDQELDPVSLRYRYSVVDRRPVVVEGVTFDAAIIAQQVVRQSGGRPRQYNANSWFVPFYGEVRSSSGGVLVETNLPYPRQALRE